MKEINNYPSLEGYGDGYSVGFNEGKIEGSEDTWKMVSNLYDISPDQLEEIFGYREVCLIVSSMTYKEASDLYYDFENKRLHVGDEFIKEGTEIRGIVTSVSYMEDICFYVLKDGYAGSVQGIETLTKTGKHYDIESILNAIDDTRD